MKLHPIADFPKGNMQALFFDETKKRGPAQGYWPDWSNAPFVVESNEYDCFSPAPWATHFISLADISDFVEKMWLKRR